MANKDFRRALREALDKVRYCTRRDDLHGNVTYVQGLIHGARFCDQIDSAQHERLYLLMQNARQHAYGHFAQQAKRLQAVPA